MRFFERSDRLKDCLRLKNLALANKVTLSGNYCTLSLVSCLPPLFAYANSGSLYAALRRRLRRRLGRRGPFITMSSSSSSLRRRSIRPSVRPKGIFALRPKPKGHRKRYPSFGRYRHNGRYKCFGRKGFFRPKDPLSVN